MKKIALAALATAIMAAPAFAVGECFPGSPNPACATPVPEISAMEGTAALAAIAAVLLLVWERRRRAA